MEFIVRFKSKSDSGFDYPYDMNTKQLGLNHVDMIRKKVKCKLELDRIYYCILPKRNNIRIELTEEQARKSKCFQEKNELVVNVPNKYFNFAVDEIIVTEKNDKTNEIIEAKIKYDINHSKVLEHWEKLNYPKEILNLNEENKI